MQLNAHEMILAFMNVFTLLTIGSYLMSKLFNVGFSPGVLCCGIFGGSAKSGKKLNIRKLAILGVYNIQRGVDSCGYYYNGNVVKGIDDNANFGVFINDKRLIPGDLPCEIFLGHTRKSTSGAHSEENAHPHVVENYVQTHNGVIRNIWELCTKRKIVHTNIHVDSIGLATIIQKEGWSVLNEYKGYAALATTFMDDPNSMYLYHGASRDIAGATRWEERPLFTLDTPEGIYYSSMKESLDCINESTKKLPIVLPHNVVYRVENGEIKEETFVVDRDDMNVPPVYVHPKPVAVTEFPFGRAANNMTALKNVGNIKERGSINNSDDESYSKVLLETRPAEHSAQDIFYWRGRYYKGHNILLDGEYFIDKSGMVVKENDGSDSTIKTYYFIRGVMIIDKVAYNLCRHENPKISTSEWLNCAYYLSKFSKYPITACDGEAMKTFGLHRRRWYLTLQPASMEFNPKFSKRKYTIKEGLLHEIKPAFKNEVVMLDKLDAEFKSYPDINDVALVEQNLWKDADGNTIALNEPSGIDAASVKAAVDITNNLRALPPAKLVDMKTVEYPYEKKTKQMATLKLPSSTVFSEIMNDSIQEMADTLYTKDGLTYIPEQLLMFMDYVNGTFYPDATDVTDSQIEDDTTTTLRDMFKLGLTYREYLVSQKADSYLRIEDVEACFAHFDEDEILSMENRYHVLNFDEEDENTKPVQLKIIKAEEIDDDSLIDYSLVDDYAIENSVDVRDTNEYQEVKQKYERLQDVLTDMEKSADDFQSTDANIAQDSCYMLYTCMDKIKANMEELITKYPQYKEIIKNIKINKQTHA